MLDFSLREIRNRFGTQDVNMKHASTRRPTSQSSNSSKPKLAPQHASRTQNVVESPFSTGERVAALQNAVGNRATTRVLARRGDANPVMLSGGSVQRTLIQRHLPGVLAKLSEDLTKVRATLNAYDTADQTNGDLMAFVNKHVTDIGALPGMVTVVDSKEKLVAALADDLVTRATEPTTLDDVMPNAIDEVMNKGGGGFTAKDGTVWMLESANDSSALYHELIHVLSGEGGVTQLSATKGMLNEGFTNYFAESLATKYGKTIFTAYPIATAWVKKFAAKFGDSVAYNLYFKDNEALLFSTLAKQMRANLVADKVTHDANKLVKAPDKPAATKFKLTEVNMYSTAGAIKDETALAVVIKKKIQESYFMEATEPGLAMMDKFIFA